MLGQLRIEEYAYGDIPPTLPGRLFFIGTELYISNPGDIVGTRLGIAIRAGARISLGDLVSIGLDGGLPTAFLANTSSPDAAAMAIALTSADIGEDVAIATRHGCVVPVAGAVNGPAYLGEDGEILSRKDPLRFQEVGFVTGQELIFLPSPLTVL